ncbi:MAG: class I SAM-dependent methyltransferase [Candidatus Eiseniibacteriota bacterium]
MSVEALKARQKLAWGLDVDAYVRFTGPELGPVADRLIEIADPGWGGSVLDVGCGPGTVTIRLAERVGPTGRVVGVDLAPPMVAYAERHAQAQGVTNTTFLVGDAEDMGDVPDAAFDIAVSNFGVIFAPRADRMVSEVARVLKPGGAFALSVWVPVGPVAETFELLASVTPPPPEDVATPESWGDAQAALARLGTHFNEVTWTEIIVPCEYASVDLAWQRMRDGRPPFALAYGRMTLDQKQEIEQRARELFRKYTDASGRVRYDRAAAIARGVRRDF